MTPSELVVRLQQPEDGLNERKETGSTEEIVEALVAFANTVPEGSEAVLFLGVSDDGRVVGVQDSDKRQKIVERLARERCYPPIIVQCHVLDDAAGKVIGVVVPYSKERPHFAGPAYVRVGSITRKAPPEVYEDLIASRNETARKILRHKGETVAVDRILQPPYGGPRSIVTQEFRIEGCSAHSVQLLLIGASTNHSVPLEQVRLSEDPVNHRPLKLTILPLV